MMTAVSSQGDYRAGEQAGSQSPLGMVPRGHDEREWALRRIKAKRELFSHFVSYLVVNAFLVGAWAMTGAGYFWPGWVLAGWGIGLVLHAWDFYWRRPISDADIEAELRRRR